MGRPVGLTITLVAAIIAGECGGTVPDARLPVACTVVEDYRRGLDLSKRWYGWHEPTPGDAKAARIALTTDYCRRVPYFRFLGNERDLLTWRYLGYVTHTDYVYRWRGYAGYTVVGIPEHPPAPFIYTPGKDMPR